MPRKAPAATPEAPVDTAAHPVVLFDGVCNLCSGSVRYVIEHDPAGRFRFAPLQSALGRALVAGCGRDPDGLETIVLIADGECYTKSAAALRIARHLEGPTRHLWHARVLPRRLRDAVYDAVAAVRYPVFGRKAQCMVPTPDIEARFLAKSDE